MTLCTECQFYCSDECLKAKCRGALAPIKIFLSVYQPLSNKLERSSSLLNTLIKYLRAWVRKFPECDASFNLAP